MAGLAERELTDHPTLIEQDIADRKHYRQLRQYSFYGVAGLIATRTFSGRIAVTKTITMT
ncbi:hypothetical protein [Caballeronia ptereochthonis]|nr:hypothetical protein [Caballeronia ptereochthonis]